MIDLTCTCHNHFDYLRVFSTKSSAQVAQIRLAGHNWPTGGPQVAHKPPVGWACIKRYTYWTTCRREYVLTGITRERVQANWQIPTLPTHWLHTKRVRLQITYTRSTQNVSGCRLPTLPTHSLHTKRVRLQIAYTPDSLAPHKPCPAADYLHS